MRLKIALIVGVWCSAAGCYLEPEPGALRPPTPTTAERVAAAARRAAQPEEPELPEWLQWYEEGVNLLEDTEYALSINAFDKSIGLAPKFALSYVNRGFSYRNIGDYKQAVADFREGIELDELGGYMHRLYLAEILAACPDASVRNGQQAVAIATQGCEDTQWKHGLMLAVLAAAYAEQGDFDEAVRWQTEGCKHVDEQLADEMQARLELYQSKSPCRRLFPDPRGLSR
jgi:tetratricopeptide (TPR) repeat protein